MSPKRAAKRATVCGVSAISGTSTITPSPRSSAAAAARRYTSVLPDPVTPWSSRASPAAASIAASAAVCAAVGSTARSAAGFVRGTRRATRGAIVTSPRASSRRSAARSSPVGPGSRSSSARWLAFTRPSAPVGSAHRNVFAFPGGGVTSASARAGVEQYSSAIHSARSTSSRGSESPRTDVGATSFSSGTSVVSASPTTTPSSFWWPNGIRTIEPISTSSSTL